MDQIMPWIIEHKWWIAPFAGFAIAIVVVRFLNS